MTREIDLRGYTDLIRAWQRLYSTWQESAKQWNDPVRQRFERQSVVPYTQATAQTIRGTEEAWQAIVQARRQCP
jgi:hypothetical protein